MSKINKFVAVIMAVAMLVSNPGGVAFARTMGQAANAGPRANPEGRVGLQISQRVGLSGALTGQSGRPTVSQFERVAVGVAGAGFSLVMPTGLSAIRGTIPDSVVPSQVLFPSVQNFALPHADLILGSKGVEQGVLDGNARFDGADKNREGGDVTPTSFAGTGGENANLKPDAGTTHNGGTQVPAAPDHEQDVREVLAVAAVVAWEKLSIRSSFSDPSGASYVVELIDDAGSEVLLAYYAEPGTLGLALSAKQDDNLPPAPPAVAPISSEVLRRHRELTPVVRALRDGLERAAGAPEHEARRRQLLKDLDAALAPIGQ
jgi:hypothetical protein